MAKTYRNAIGDRIEVRYDADFGEGSSVSIAVRDGWNSSCQFRESKLSIEEARGLHYLLGRLIEVATE